MSTPLFDVVVETVKAEPVPLRGTPAVPRSTTKCYRVNGPGGREWSIWDFGDEMTVHEGPGLLDEVAARVPVEKCRRMTAGDRWRHVEDAAGAIHVAKLLEEFGQPGSPTFHLLWRAGR